MMPKMWPWPNRMQSLRTTHLIIVVLLLSALAIISNEFTGAGLLSFDTHKILVYLVFMINTAIAILGLWTPRRAAWLGYLVAGFASMILIGASTPISALWIFTKLL